MLDAVLYKQFLLSYISAKPHACQRGYNVYPPSSLIQDLERGSGGDAKLRKCALRLPDRPTLSADFFETQLSVCSSQPRPTPHEAPGKTIRSLWVEIHQPTIVARPCCVRMSDA